VIVTRCTDNIMVEDPARTLGTLSH
jgi:hypothetical protein